MEKQQAQGLWRLAWLLVRLEQVKFMPNSHAAMSHVAEVTNPKFDI